MKGTMQSALQAMEAMQRDWDQAVAANAAELTDLRASAAAEARKQIAETAALESMKGEMQEQAKAIESLASQRQSLSQEEVTMRDRYAKLRQRRIDKLVELGRMKPSTTNAPFDLPAVDEVAASAEKAAQAFRRFFG